MEKNAFDSYLALRSFRKANMERTIPTIRATIWNLIELKYEIESIRSQRLRNIRTENIMRMTSKNTFCSLFMNVGRKKDLKKLGVN